MQMKTQDVQLSKLFHKSSKIQNYAFISIQNFYNIFFSNKNALNKQQNVRHINPKIDYRRGIKKKQKIYNYIRILYS